MSLSAIGLNRDSTAITAMIRSGIEPIRVPSRYAVATRLRVASIETAYRFASEAASASISGEHRARQRSSRASTKRFPFAEASACAGRRGKARADARRPDARGGTTPTQRVPATRDDGAAAKR
jgi:hypothetical protein